MTTVIQVMFALCLLWGGECELVESRVTTYAPGLGGVNCEPYCDGYTATMTPAIPGIVAACDANRLGQLVYIDGVGWRECQDTGGAITGHDVDVLIDEADCEWVGGYCAHPWSDNRQVMFVEERDGRVD